MPTPMMATLTVRTMDGTVTAESSHPSFELAWKQARMDLSEKNVDTYMDVELTSDQYDELWLPKFDAAFEMIDSALPGEGSAYFGTSENYIVRYDVTAYQPLP